MRRADRYIYLARQMHVIVLCGIHRRRHHHDCAEFPLRLLPLCLPHGPQCFSRVARGIGRPAQPAARPPLVLDVPPSSSWFPHYPKLDEWSPWLAAANGAPPCLPQLNSWNAWALSYRKECYYCLQLFVGADRTTHTGMARTAGGMPGSFAGAAGPPARPRPPKEMRKT